MRTVETQRDLETRLVGSLLTQGDVFWELPAGFGPQALTVPSLRAGFEAIARRASAKALGPHPVNVRDLAATDRLPDPVALDLEMAQAAIGSAAQARHLAELLLDSHRRRTLAALLAESVKALQGDAATVDVTGRLVTELLDLGKGDAPEVVSFRDAVMSTLDVIERQKSGKGSVLKTGLPDLDRILHIRPGNLVILAARPGIGKTTLALNVADNLSMSMGHVLVHSLEMKDQELVTLALSRAARIDSETFFTEEGWPQSQWDRLGAEMEKRLGGGDGRLWINDSHHSLGAICRITEKMHRKHGLSLVVVDYLQLIQVDLGKGVNREQQVATIARTLKLMAQRIGLPVLALSQLNRAPEQRNNAIAAPKCAKCGDTEPRHRGQNWDGHPFEKPVLLPPKLHDLRESGAIEQDANAVLFLHHPHAESDDIVKRKSGPYELIVAKQRLGKKGKVYLLAELEHAQFRPFTRTDAPGDHWATKGDQ